MKKIVYFCSLSFLLILLIAFSGKISFDREHREISHVGIDGVLEAILMSVEELREGSTRADLQEMFERDGGLSTRTQGTFTSNVSRYIKVDVSFKNLEEGVVGMDDPIIEISKPYIERIVID